jgi:presenilin-like A22 family membrane protease
MSQSEKAKSRDFSSFAIMAILLLVTDALALFVAQPFEAVGIIAFENPTDPFNLAYLFLTLIVVTAVILLISRFWKKQIILAIVLGSTGLLVFYVLYPFLTFALPVPWSLILSAAIVVFLLTLLIKYPEWYVIDTVGILVGLATMAMLGISLSVTLVILLLIVMAIYDAISVYQTKHMIDLADTVIDLKLPVLLVIPRDRKYSLLAQKKSLKQKLEDQEEREASFMGLGDIIFPGTLAVSAFVNLPTNGLIVAFSVMIGTLIGFTLLATLVMKGKPQAGLPLLCSGAILGYVVSSLLLFGRLVGLGF